LVEVSGFGATDAVAMGVIDDAVTVFGATVGVAAAAPRSVCTSTLPVVTAVVVVLESRMLGAVLNGRGRVTPLVVIGCVAVPESPDCCVAVHPKCREPAERDPVEVVVAEATAPSLGDTLLAGAVWRVG
jgi:hypothetical protein